MNISVMAFSLIMIVFGVIFIIFAFTGVGITNSQIYVPNTFSLPQVYAITSLLLLIGGGIVMVNGSRSRASLFVCGVCNLTFLEESDLRKHYAIEHVKKDSNEKKD